jgi:SMP-30/Gluconolactonase/LRE-like region
VSTSGITTVLSDVCYLECPRWHDGRIWVSDFYTYRVLSAEEDGSDLRVEAEVPQQPSGIGWLPDGRLLVVSMRDRRVLRREDDGSLVTHADLGAHVTGHPNDMVVDARGRAYVGSFGFDLMGGADVAPAALLRVDTDGSVSQVADDLWFPNGCALTDDGVLLVDETFGNRVTAFDVADDGGLTNRRVWASFGDLPTKRQLALAIGQLKVAPTAAASTPRAPSGSPTPPAAARSGCGRAVRSSHAVPLRRPGLRRARAQPGLRGPAAVGAGRRTARRPALTHPSVHFRPPRVRPIRRRQRASDRSACRSDRAVRDPSGPRCGWWSSAHDRAVKGRSGSVDKPLSCGFMW